MQIILSLLCKCGTHHQIIYSNAIFAHNASLIINQLNTEIYATFQAHSQIYSITWNPEGKLSHFNRNLYKTWQSNDTFLHKLRQKKKKNAYNNHEYKNQRVHIFI